MKLTRTKLLAACLAVTVTVVANHDGLTLSTPKDAGPVVRSLADGRSGDIRFVSYGPTRNAIARGGFRQRPVALHGTLDLPRGSARPVPAAILVHGSDGLSARQHRQAKALNARGIATLVLDSFAPRGVDTTVGRQDAVPAHVMVVDLFVALELLASHPRIDPTRIAVIGWSKGGVAADWASREWYRSRLVARDVRFAAHVAFYAWCGEQEARIELTGAPILYLSGELDDWAGTEPCVGYARRARRAGYDARVVVYPGAHHGFDYRGSFHRYLPEARSWSDCVYLARDTGFVEQATGVFAAWPDLSGYLSRCSRTGAHVASNAGARTQAARALKEFLSEFLETRPRV